MKALVTKVVTKRLVMGLKGVSLLFLSHYAKHIRTPIRLIKNRKKTARYLEIGPGLHRILGFETLNVCWCSNVDYVADASKKLPFNANTFDIIYASHILEHTPWYQQPKVLKEWVRVLKTGGAIEIWVPNGLLIARTFVEAEDGLVNNIHMDGWYKFNEEQDACVWANGRIFSYGDGLGTKTDPNWHLALFSPRYLVKLMRDSGLTQIEQLSSKDVRGYDHGWINLGFRGVKP